MRIKHFLEWRVMTLLNGFQDAVAYRLEFIIELLGSAFAPAAIQLVLWYALFKVGGATEIAGMTYADMLQYTFMTVLFSQIRGGDNDFELAEMIRSGQLSNYLLRPVSVIEFIYLRGIAPKLLIASISLIVGITTAAYLGYNPMRMIGAVLLALVGNVIHYQIGAALSSMSFYWEEAYSVLMVKNMIVALLSGEMIPLTLFPPSVQWIWKSTPFYLYVFGPTQYALGHWTHMEFLRQLGIAGLWCVAGTVLVKTLWRIGIHRYQSLGG